MPRVPRRPRAPTAARSPRRRSTITTLALILILHAFAGHAYAPERTPLRELQAAGVAAARHPAASGSRLGLLVSRGGNPLVARAADDTFIPASLMKLATTVAALRRFGADHRFRTVVRAIGGTAREPTTLALIGGGDSTFATERHRRSRFLPDPDDRFQRPAFPSGSPTVQQLAAGIVASGVHRVRGDLVADDTVFDRDWVPDGWPARYFGYDAESGLISGLVVNEARTSPERHYNHPDPPRQAAEVLRAELARRGVLIDGRIRVAPTPPGSRFVAAVESPPLAEIIDFILRYSANYQAELLFKSLGAEFGREGSYTASERVVRAALLELDVPLAGFRQEDGSGLSVLDRATPRTIVALLQAILDRPILAAARLGIPVAGGQGTLEKRLVRWPTRGNLRGKTGLLRGVRAMAGWVRGRDGVPLVYVVIYNQGRSAIALSDPIDFFALALAFHPRTR